MRALTWHGIEDVRVTEVPDPVIEQTTDAVVRVTSTAICGSDLHLYGTLAPYLQPGDVLGHEFMGIVEQVGSDVATIQPGDRVVVPFNISCGRCWMCQRGLFAQCETTQNVAQGKGASLFGYTSLYGSVPGGQAELVRVPHADFGPIELTSDLPDERFLYLSDILPTAWQAVEYADVNGNDTLAVLGLGPVGQLALRSALHRGVGRVIAVDLVDDRLALARSWGADVVDVRDVDEVVTHSRTSPRVADRCCRRRRRHGGTRQSLSEKVIGAASRLPKPVARAAIERVGIDRLSALHTAIAAVRRGGTLSISGVYGGMADPMPMMELFDKGLTVRMGQCHVRRWSDDLLDLVSGSDDVLGLEGLATHHAPLEEPPELYRTFQEKRDDCLKVVLKP